jgi:DNA helicase-2/ATP-dependent DNA helicase PcrA
MSFDRQAKAGGMSPFLAELSPALLDSGERGSATIFPAETSAPGRAPTQVGRGARDISRLTAGAAVRHPFFGTGQVEKMTGKNSVEVFFPRHGRKTLHLDYAKLEIVD